MVMVEIAAAEPAQPPQEDNATHLWPCSLAFSQFSSRSLISRQRAECVLLHLEMDGSAGSAGARGYFVAPPCADEQPEAKRRCLNLDRQAWLMQLHGANTIQHHQILANSHWTPDNWNIYISQVQAPNQFVDYYQPSPAYGNQALGQWPSNDVFNSPYAVVDEPEPQPEPSALDSDIAQSPLEETEILVCYGMVSGFIFTRRASNHLRVRRPTVPTLSLLPSLRVIGLHETFI